MNIIIDNEKCFKCGKKFNNDKEKHHGIPKCLKPKHNVIFYLHRNCHLEVNQLYVSQQKKDKSEKLKNIIGDLMIKLNSVLEQIEEK